MISKGLIVLASAFVALADGSQVLKTGGKIVGGIEAAAGEIPWQVSLQFNSGLHFCGGAIISDKWIVTAAFCSDGLKVEDLRVISGTLEKYNPGSIHFVYNVMVHEDYNPLTLENDIALWQISDTFTWDANTAPVNLLPQGTPSPVGTETVVSGWGDSHFNGVPSETLLKVVVPIFDTATCESNYSGLFITLYHGMICAGLAKGGVDFCAGDVGGPLFIDGNLHGVASWGYNCALPDYPGVYTQVSAFRDWITTNSGV